MQINLLYEDTDEMKIDDAVYKKDMITDLKMDLLLQHMADQNTYLYEVCKTVIMNPLVKEEAILMRQSIMKEAVKKYSIFNKLYQIATDAMEKSIEYRKFTEPKYYQIVPTTKKIITESEISTVLLEQLQAVMNVLDDHSITFEASRLRAFQKNMSKQFTPEYFLNLKHYIQSFNLLKEKGQLIISGHLGAGLKETDIILNNLLDTENKNEQKTKVNVFNNINGLC